MQNIIKIFPAVIILVMSLPAFSQKMKEKKCTVSIVNGIIIRDDLKPVQAGDTLGWSDIQLLRFSRVDDNLVVTHPDYGRNIVTIIDTKQGKKEKKQSEFAEQSLLLLNLKWERARQSYQSSGFPVLPALSELQSTAPMNGKILVEQPSKYLFDTKRFPVDINHVFLLQGKCMDTLINQLLTVSGDTLLIRIKDVEAITEKIRSDQCEFYLTYYYGDTQDGERIQKFKPYPDKNGKLADLVKALAGSLKKPITKDQLYDEAYTQACYYLGKPSSITLTELVNSNYHK